MMQVVRRESILGTGIDISI